MINTHQGILTEPQAKIAIVISRFNELVTKNLLRGAINKLVRQGVPQNNIDVYWVPGAFEIPLICQKLARRRDHQAIIALGAVIRGETSHYDLVAEAVGTGVAKVNLEYEIPVIFGVLTTETLSQAINRAGGKYGNKGAEAAEAAIEMVGLIKKL